MTQIAAHWFLCTCNSILKTAQYPALQYFGLYSVPVWRPKKQKEKWETENLHEIIFTPFFSCRNNESNPPERILRIHPSQLIKLNHLEQLCPRTLQSLFHHKYLVTRDLVCQAWAAAANGIVRSPISRSPQKKYNYACTHHELDCSIIVSQFKCSTGTLHALDIPPWHEIQYNCNRQCVCVSDHDRASGRLNNKCDIYCNRRTTLLKQQTLSISSNPAASAFNHKPSLLL